MQLNTEKAGLRLLADLSACWISVPGYYLRDDVLVSCWKVRRQPFRDLL